jgi:hypothetical protein
MFNVVCDYKVTSNFSDDKLGKHTHNQIATVHKKEKNRYEELTTLTWYRIDTTAPQISSPTMNCSPSIARTRFSQQRDANPFLSRKINLPPL